jgi:predicted porin
MAQINSYLESKIMKMIKKLIPAAILLATAGAAQAQVTVYGLVDMSYGKNEYVPGVTKADFHSGGDDYSSQGNSTTRVGIKGSAEVAPGIKANFNLETAGINSDGKVGDAGGWGGPDQAFFNRQAWAGFSGKFGEVRLGKQDSVAFQMMNGYDLNGASNGVSAGGYAGVAPWATGRVSRSLQYITPEMGGIKAQVGFVPEGNVAGGKAAFSAAVNYTAGAFSAGVVGESKNTDAGDDFKAVAASYDFKVAKLVGSYADGGSRKGPGFGISAPVAGYTVGMHYAKNTESKDTYTEFFVNREIFKNTYGYAELGNGNLNTASDQTSYAVGVIYVF